MSIRDEYTQPALFDEMNLLEELAYLEAQANRSADQEQFNSEYDSYVKDIKDKAEKSNVIQKSLYKFPEMTSMELAGFTPCTSPAVAIPGSFSAMLISRKSNRITFSNEVVEGLNYPQGVVVSLGINEIAIATGLPGNRNYFNLHPYGEEKYSIYSTSLAHEIRAVYGLITVNEVPYTFRKKRFVKFGEETICLIEVPKEASIVGEQMKIEVGESQ